MSDEGSTSTAATRDDGGSLTLSERARRGKWERKRESGSKRFISPPLPAAMAGVRVAAGETG